jgi:hypothetical protein
VTVAWARLAPTPFAVEARTHVSPGRFGPVQQLGSGADPRVAVDGAGRVGILWNLDEVDSQSVATTIGMRTAERGRPFGPLTALPGHSPALVLDDRGGAFLAQAVVLNETQYALALRRGSLAGGFGEPEHVSSVGKETGPCCFSLAAGGGRAVMAWSVIRARAYVEAVIRE